MKRIILIFILIQKINAGDININDEMIFDSITNAFRNIPKSIESLGSYTNKMIKGEKGYYQYVKENQKMERILKEKKIDYITILKQKMYPTKIYETTIQAKKKKYKALKEIIQNNEIHIQSEQTIEKKKKKKLKIIMTDKE